MFSLEYIKAQQDEHTKTARENNLQPYTATQDNDPKTTTCKFLGYYLPKEWELTGREFFVNNSGFGQEGEPALTPNQFLQAVKKGKGYAIKEAGQFQVYIREYKKRG